MRGRWWGREEEEEREGEQEPPWLAQAQDLRVKSYHGKITRAYTMCVFRLYL